MWDLKQDSEPELDILYKNEVPSREHYHQTHTRVPEEQAARAALTLTSRPNPVNREPLGHSEVLKMAKANQRKQAKQTKAKPKPKGRSKEADTNRATTFAQKSKEAALKHSQQTRSEKRKLLYSSSSEKKSFAKATPSNTTVLNKKNVQHPGKSHWTHLQDNSILRCK